MTITTIHNQVNSHRKLRIEALEGEDERAYIRTQVEKSIVLETYESENTKTNPIMQDIWDVIQRRTRRHTITFSISTWDGNIVPFRQSFICVAR
jgi:hypothetical protein